MHTQNMARYKPRSKRDSQALAAARVDTLPLALVRVAPEIPAAVAPASCVPAPVRSLPATTENSQDKDKDRDKDKDIDIDVVVEKERAQNGIQTSMPSIGQSTAIS